MVSRGGSRRPVERSSAVPLRDNLPPVKEEEEGERAAFDFLESGNLSSVRFPNPTFHIGHCKLRGGERIAGLSNFTFPSEKPTLNLKCNNFTCLPSKFCHSSKCGVGTTGFKPCL